MNKPFMLKHLIKLARPTQWSKSGFVLIGPFYVLADGHLRGAGSLVGAFWAAAAFALVASSCYALNDVRDAEQDRVHPRNASARSLAARSRRERRRCSARRLAWRASRV
ncbi:MAG: hypothetical protein QM783_00325 [Phycisphaerales bacterium]